MKDSAQMGFRFSLAPLKNIPVSSFVHKVFRNKDMNSFSGEVSQDQRCMHFMNQSQAWITSNCKKTIMVEHKG